MDFDNPPADPVAQVNSWLLEAKRPERENPHAMTLATVDPDGRRTYLRASLFDLDLTSMVFESFQESFSTVNESFTLGLSEGDLTNIFTGSLSGTLIAGHEYHFFYNAFVQAPAVYQPPPPAQRALGTSSSPSPRSPSQARPC